MTMANTNRPTHDVHHVTGEGEKSRWNKIGAAWENADGEGFSLKLDYLPLTPSARIVVRKAKPKQQREER
jgi:hypothetical protein